MNWLATLFPRELNIFDTCIIYNSFRFNSLNHLQLFLGGNTLAKNIRRTRNRLWFEKFQDIPLFHLLCYYYGFHLTNNGGIKRSFLCCRQSFIKVF